MKSPIDTGFIHDISQLDMIRQKATQADGSQEALRAVAAQFEAIFTQMLFKSMRQTNEAFESGLLDNRTEKIYQQLADEQLSSNLAQKGALGLADLIVAQFSTLQPMRPQAQNKQSKPVTALPNLKQKTQRLTQPKMAQVTQQPAQLEPQQTKQTVSDTAIAPKPRQEPAFISPEDFVSRLFPLAQKAANKLGVDPDILLAQAALETGWGKQVIASKTGSSHNLFNIKAQQGWTGEKITTSTVEYQESIAVQEKSAFRGYDSFQASFDDYIQLIKQSPRYQNALQVANDAKQFIQTLHQAGYATDPHYSEKVIGVFEQIKRMVPVLR